MRAVHPSAFFPRYTVQPSGSPTNSEPPSAVGDAAPDAAVDAVAAQVDSVAIDAAAREAAAAPPTISATAAAFVPAATAAAFVPAVSAAAFVPAASAGAFVPAATAAIDGGDAAMAGLGDALSAEIDPLLRGDDKDDLVVQQADPNSVLYSLRSFEDLGHLEGTVPM